MAHDLEQRVSCPQRAVLRLGATGLPHEPDRGRIHRLAPAGPEEAVGWHAHGSPPGRASVAVTANGLSRQLAAPHTMAGRRPARGAPATDGPMATTSPST